MRKTQTQGGREREACWRVTCVSCAAGVPDQWTGISPKETIVRQFVIVVTCLLTLNATVLAQEKYTSHRQTAPPPNARFEIIQSAIVARLTFRLDKFTGNVAQLVSTDDNGLTWEPMSVLGLPAITSPSRPRFQIFTSGIAARFGFLIDTGKTWQVVAGGDDVTVWQPLSP